MSQKPEARMLYVKLPLKRNWHPSRSSARDSGFWLLASGFCFFGFFIRR
jgi:hypothetical protein